MNFSPGDLVIRTPARPTDCVLCVRRVLPKGSVFCRIHSTQAGEEIRGDIWMVCRARTLTRWPVGTGLLVEHGTATLRENPSGSSDDSRWLESAQQITADLLKANIWNENAFERAMVFGDLIGRLAATLNVPVSTHLPAAPTPAA